MFTSCGDVGGYSETNNEFLQGNFTDTRDNKTYKYTTIGTQTWMAENLNYNVEGSRCYNDDPANCNEYGRLYNWETAMKVCPDGWYLPSDAEWDVLVNYAGGFSTAGKKLKATSGWYNNGNGTDIYGFAALPGGYGYYSGDGFYYVGYYSFWWSTSENGTNAAYYRGMGYDYGAVVRYDYHKEGLHIVPAIYKAFE